VLTAFILGTNTSNVDYFYRCCLGVRDLSIPHILDVRPPLHQLVRMLNTHLPQVVFLEVDQQGQSFQTAVDILVAAPGTTVIGFGHEATDELLAEAREFGIEDILPAPYEDREVFVVIQTAMKSPASQSRPVVAFQPATAGCGASTIALNVASTLANQFKRKVLLIDADLRSSPLPFWFSHDPEPTIVEALNACDNLTERSWQQMIWNARGVGMLLTSRHRGVAAPSFRRGTSCECLVSRRVVMIRSSFDLPEVIDDVLGVVRERADFKFVVCTSDRISAAMARRRIDEMKVGGAEVKNVGIIVNKVASKCLAKVKIEQIARRPVAPELPVDDDPNAEKSLLGSLLQRRSKLVKGYKKLAEAIDRQAVTRRPVGMAKATEDFVAGVARAANIR
jgi:Flp pilus assembly CpaE family ATPase